MQEHLPFAKCTLLDKSDGFSRVLPLRLAYILPIYLFALVCLCWLGFPCRGWSFPAFTGILLSEVSSCSRTCQVPWAIFPRGWDTCYQTEPSFAGENAAASALLLPPPELPWYPKISAQSGSGRNKPCANPRDSGVLTGDTWVCSAWQTTGQLGAVVEAGEALTNPFP